MQLSTDSSTRFCQNNGLVLTVDCTGRIWNANDPSCMFSRTSNLIKNGEYIVFRYMSDNIYKNYLGRVILQYVDGTLIELYNSTYWKLGTSIVGFTIDYHGTNHDYVSTNIDIDIKLKVQ